jgi:hypothetical protein
MGEGLGEGDAGQEPKCLGGHGWPREAVDGVGGFAAFPSPGALRAPTSPARGEVIFSAPLNTPVDVELLLPPRHTQCCFELGRPFH